MTKYYRGLKLKAQDMLIPIKDAKDIKSLIN